MTELSMLGLNGLPSPAGRLTLRCARISMRRSLLLGSDRYNDAKEDAQAESPIAGLSWQDQCAMVGGIRIGGLMDGV